MSDSHKMMVTNSCQMELRDYFFNKVVFPETIQTTKMYLDTVFTYVYIHNYIQLIGKEKLSTGELGKKLQRSLGKDRKRGDMILL